MERTGVARQVALGAAIFGATLVILLGLTAVLRPSGASPSPSPAAVASPTPAPHTPTGEPSTTDPPSDVPSPSTSAAASPSASASVATSPGGFPVLVGAGDIAACDSERDDATAELIADLVADDGATVFTAGDNVYPRAERETFDECFAPSWGRVKSSIRPAPGNHDWDSGSLDAYFGYFGDAARNDEGDPWYAYTLGSWHVVVLDSDCDRVEGCDPASRQGQWLADTLAASDAACTIAIWHRPRFSSGFHGNDATVAPFWEALYAAGADIVVNGHDHDYERFAPQSPDGQEDRERGIRQFVAGTGGTSLRPFESVAPNSELRVATEHGVLAFTLKDGSYDWRFIPSKGDFSDAGTAFCH